MLFGDYMKEAVNNVKLKWPADSEQILMHTYNWGCTKPTTTKTDHISQMGYLIWWYFHPH